MIFKLPPEKIFGCIVHRVPPFCLKICMYVLYVRALKTKPSYCAQCRFCPRFFSYDIFEELFSKLSKSHMKHIWAKESKKLHRVPNKQKPRKKKDELEVVHQIEMEKIPAWWNRAQFSYTVHPWIVCKVSSSFQIR